MNINREREAIIKRLKDKKHRDAFVSASVDQTIPFQIRALRMSNEREWTQQELANRAGMKQERISTCENPDYGRFSLQTLKQLASAFDVALIVRFAPFSELVEWETNISNETLSVPSFDQEEYFKEDHEKSTAQDFLKKVYPPTTLKSEASILRNLSSTESNIFKSKKEGESSVSKLVTHIGGAQNAASIH